jgi:hypothetical protein
MRARAPISAALLVSALTVLACSADQPTTAPDVTPSFFVARKSYTFSLTCTNAGPSTVAHVLIVLNSTVSAPLDPLSCGSEIANVTNFRSIAYNITVTDATDQPRAICEDTKPIRSGPVTCQVQSTQISAVLTIAG